MKGWPIPPDSNKQMLSNNDGILSFDSLINELGNMTEKQKIQKQARLSKRNHAGKRKHAIKQDMNVFAHVDGNSVKFSFKNRRYPVEMVRDAVNLEIKEVMRKWNISRYRIKKLREYVANGSVTI